MANCILHIGSFTSSLIRYYSIPTMCQVFHWVSIMYSIHYLFSFAWFCPASGWNTRANASPWSCHVPILLVFYKDVVNGIHWKDTGRWRKWCCAMSSLLPPIFKPFLSTSFSLQLYWQPCTSSLALTGDCEQLSVNFPAFCHWGTHFVIPRHFSLQIQVLEMD
jgi:hypothetical protein